MSTRTAETLAQPLKQTGVRVRRPRRRVPRIHQRAHRRSGGFSCHCHSVQSDRPETLERRVQHGACCGQAAGAEGEEESARPIVLQGSNLQNHNNRNSVLPKGSESVLQAQAWQQSVLA